MILQANDVHKSFGSLEILNGVSLSIETPQTIAIMGRSGCGKSTFLSLLAGLDAPTTGVVELLDQDLAKLSDRDLNRFRARHVGIVFQQFHLLDHLTAFENVRLPLDLNGIGDPDQKAREMLAKVGLEHRADHFPDTMSRGECQRIAIARVLVMRPEILFADEPTGSLDIKTGRDVIELLFNLARSEKLALVMATHDPAVAAKCEKLLYMDAGRLTSDRPPAFAPPSV